MHIIHLPKCFFFSVDHLFENLLMSTCWTKPNDIPEKHFKAQHQGPEGASNIRDADSDGSRFRHSFKGKLNEESMSI